MPRYRYYCEEDGWVHENAAAAPSACKNDSAHQVRDESLCIEGEARPAFVASLGASAHAASATADGAWHYLAGCPAKPERAVPLARAIQYAAIVVRAGAMAVGDVQLRICEDAAVCGEPYDVPNTGNTWAAVGFQARDAQGAPVRPTAGIHEYRVEYRCAAGSTLEWRGAVQCGVDRE